MHFYKTINVVFVVMGIHVNQGIGFVSANLTCNILKKK